jgi:hypothetical protein
MTPEDFNIQTDISSAVQEIKDPLLYPHIYAQVLTSGDFIAGSPTWCPAYHKSSNAVKLHSARGVDFIACTCS